MFLRFPANYPPPLPPSHFRWILSPNQSPISGPEKSVRSQPCPPYPPCTPCSPEKVAGNARALQTPALELSRGLRRLGLVPDQPSSLGQPSLLAGSQARLTGHLDRIIMVNDAARHQIKAFSDRDATPHQINNRRPANISAPVHRPCGRLAARARLPATFSAESNVLTRPQVPLSWQAIGRTGG
jgi:hypothetical protein